MQAFYGIDTASGVLHERSAVWLQWRITGLLWRPDSCLARAVRPNDEGS